MFVMLDNQAFLPERAHETDAGLDLRSPVYALVPHGGSVLIDTAVASDADLIPMKQIVLQTVGGLAVMSGALYKGGFLR